MSPSLDPPDAPWRRAVADADAGLDPDLAAAPSVLARFKRALNLSLAFVALIGAVYLMQGAVFATDAAGLVPRSASGLLGVLTAPLLHGSSEHLVNNAFGVLVLGTLAGTVFPKATVRALPLIWLGGGLGTWAIAQGGVHIGASGVVHGLGFLLFGLAILRRDRPAIAAAMIAFFFFGSMLLTVLPQELGVSWEYHLSGAVLGMVAAGLWFRADPAPPRRRYSWEDEEEEAARLAAEADPEHELPRPDDVPVLWHRPAPPAVGTVLPFRRRDPEAPSQGREPGP
jgi:membrane associated rhomboid family serine protease